MRNAIISEVWGGYTIQSIVDYVKGCEAAQKVLNDELTEEIRKICGRFARFLPKGFQAVVQIALHMPEFDGVPADLLECDNLDEIVLQECQRTHTWTLMDFHYVVSTEAGQSGRFAEVKMHTLQRVPDLEATGSWGYQEFLEKIQQYGALKGRLQAVEHLTVGKNYHCIEELQKESHEYVRDMADITAFKGGLRFPFSSQTAYKILADGEVRISFSALSQEQDEVMTLLFKDAIKRIRNIGFDSMDGEAWTVISPDTEFTFNLTEELMYRFSPTAAFHEVMSEYRVKC